jgi:RNA polymerase sigma-70 factor (ECF subfamily)
VNTLPDNSPSDLDSLIARAAQGDEHVYDELLERCAERLRQLAARMLRNFPRVRRWEETDDVLQMTMLRLHRSLHEVKPTSLREFWLHAATQIRRTLIDFARHHYGAHGGAAHHHSDGEERAIKQQRAEVDRPETLVEWARFHEIVEKLPSEEAEVFQLVWYGGMTQTEVADLLDVSSRTVMRRVHRARLLIHSAFQGQSPHEE